MLKNNKTYSALALALVVALGGSLSANDVVAAANNSQANNNGKSLGQLSKNDDSDLAAGFIIKFKKNSRMMNEVAQAASAKGQNRAAMVANEASRVAQELSGELGNTIKFNRGMGLPAHFVFDSDKRMNRKQAERLLAKIARHPDVESVEVNQLMQPLATPNDPSYADQWHY